MERERVNKMDKLGMDADGKKSIFSAYTKNFKYNRQSTCLIRVDNITILTDPVFTNCSINDYLGPKRLRPIPCTLDEIASHIDMVLVSHDHFDHLGKK